MKLFGKHASNIKLNNPWRLFDNYGRDVSKPSSEDFEYMKAMYDREIRYSDDVIKTLFEEMEKLEFLKNFIAIITGDHGDEFGEHGGWGHRSLLYDELLHIPLIIVGSKVPKNKVIRQMVGTIDFMPTILAYAGIDCDLFMEGRDLLSTGISDSKNEYLFAQCSNIIYCIRTPLWKLIENMTPHRIELYQLINDPAEKYNLSDSLPEQANNLLKSLNNWRITRLKIDDLKQHKVNYSKEALEKLRTLGYIK